MTVDSFYVGPGRPALAARTWQQLVSAAQTGVLAETQWIELKRDIPAAAEKANLELARDLASLSVDGGVLLVGVADPGRRPEDVVGITDVDGLRERIAQVAGSNRVSPPLHLTTHVIPHHTKTALAVLLVEVPASANAPHMVDERYWGRSATGKRPLHDVDVQRVQDRRRGRREDLQQRLLALPTTLDPTAPADRAHGHLYLLIEPATTPAGPRVEPDGEHPLNLVVRHRSFQPRFKPSLELLTHEVAHPDGIAAASLSMEQRPIAAANESKLLYLLLTDSGAAHVVSGGATQDIARDPERRAIWVNHVLEVAHQALEVAAGVAEEQYGYRGEWRVGVLITGVTGRLSVQAYSEQFMSRWRPAPYQGGDYLRQVAAAHADLRERPSSVVQALLQDFARGLGLRDVLFPYGTGAEIGTRG